MTARKAPELDPTTLRWVADVLKDNGDEHWRSAIKWRMPERACEDQAEWHEAVFRVLLGHVKRLRNRATRIERERDFDPTPPLIMVMPKRGKP